MAAAVIASLVLGTAVLVLVLGTVPVEPVLFAMHGGTVGCAVAVSMRLASDAAPALLNCCVELLALGVVTGGCCFFFNASYTTQQHDNITHILHIQSYLP